MRPLNFLHHPRHKLLRHIHQVVIVSVGHVELTSRKLGIMRQINRLITELPADFVYSLQPAYDEHFQVQLWRHPHKQVQFEVVVVRDEGLGCSSARNHVHHWRLHLQETPLVQIPPQIVNNLGSSDKFVPNPVINDQIEVSLSITGFLIFESVMRFGEHMQTGSQQLNLLCKQRQLSLHRPPSPSRDTNQITASQDIMGLEERFECISITFTFHSLCICGSGMAKVGCVGVNLYFHSVRV